MRGFSALADALPGLGGLDAYDRLELGDATLLVDTINTRRTREAQAYKKPRKVR